MYERMCATICHLGIPRLKIDSIITRGTPVPDPDCPEDAESVRFWCTAGGNFSEKERTKIQAKASATIETNGENLAAMVGAPDLGGPGGSCGNRPTLRSLVDVANAPGSGNGGGNGAPKAKAKAKAKSRAVGQQGPKTPDEQRVAIRIPIKNYFKSFYM